MDARSMVAVTLAFLMLGTAGAVTGLEPEPEVVLHRSVDPAPAYQQGFRWDYAGWERDSNNDGLDDLVNVLANQGIQGLPKQSDGFLPFSVHTTGDGPVMDLHLAFQMGVGSEDVQRLNDIGIDNVIVDPVMPAALVSSATPAQAEEISRLPGVIMVEIQQVFRALNNGARAATQVQDSSTYANGVWDDLGYTGDDVGIAILDTGVDDSHPWLANRFVAGADAVAPCGVGRALEVNPDDDNQVSVGIIGVGLSTFHGTHVAGTALGHGVGPFFNHAGMAREADLYDVKVLTPVGLSCLNSVTLGLGFVNLFNTGGTIVWQNALSPLVVPASKSIDVVSMSLGGACSDGLDALSQNVNWIVNTGVTVVVAAGNDGVQRSSGSPGCITSPAAATDAITVGAFNDRNTATRSDDFVAPFSNCGPSVASPSSDQKKPDVTAPGVDIYSSLGSIVPQGELLTTSGHSLQGTSMATPVVAGIVALMLDKDPTLSPSDVKDFLRSTADHQTGGSAGYNFDPQYHTCWGYGAVNAYDAVNAI